MKKNKQKVLKDKPTKGKLIYKAVVHIVWIIIISMMITVLINEIFQGSKISNLIILVLIGVYIIFSFVRKFWAEKNQKKVMETIDITMTLVGGLFCIMTSVKPAPGYNVGQAFIQNILGNATAQPHIGVFYLGILLLIISVVRIFLVNRSRVLDKATLQTYP